MPRPKHPQSANQEESGTPQKIEALYRNCNTDCMNVFLSEVIDRLCDVIKNLPASVIQHITGRQWIVSIL